MIRIIWKHPSTHLCCECDDWIYQFETDSMLIGKCMLQKGREVEGMYDPYFNDCPKLSSRRFGNKNALKVK